MAMDALEIERRIREALPDAQVTIEELRGGRMGTALHALALTTAAPNQ